MTLLGADPVGRLVDAFLRVSIAGTVRESKVNCLVVAALEKVNKVRGSFDRQSVPDRDRDERLLYEPFYQ